MPSSTLLYIRQLKFYMEEDKCQYLDQTPRIKRGPSSLRNPPEKCFVLELPASEAFSACAAQMANTTEWADSNVSWWDGSDMCLQ